MYQARSPSDRRPPLPDSPSQIRTRKYLRASITLSTPLSRPGKSLIPKPPASNLHESTVRFDLKPMLGEYQALAKMVEDELGRSHHAQSLLTAISSTPQFERGRLYDEYSARRSERLCRKKRERETSTMVEDHNNAGFSVEFVKKKSAKKCESAVRKSVPTNFSVGRREGLRSSTRLSKENMKPPLSGGGDWFGAAAIDGQRKRMTTRSSRNL